MQRDSRRARAASFGGVADEYERGRPAYPDAAVAWLAGDLPRDVVDLAAGTGKLTRGLVAAGHRVTAVEPSERMLARLRGGLPSVRALAGSAERVPLPAGAADVVTVAQAFHWFDVPAVLGEIARVLRPGGRLGLVWNTRDDSVAWVARLSALIGSESVSEARSAAAIDASELFGPVERATFRHEQRLDRAGLLALAASRSFCATLEPEERGRILEEIGRLWDASARGGSLVLPYACEAFRAKLLPRRNADREAR